MGKRRRRGVRHLADAQGILVVRLDEIGDVVLTSPFLRELRRNVPAAWITLIVKPELRNLVELCPYINEVRTYDWRSSGRYWIGWRHWRAVQLARRHLWSHRFDFALLPRYDADYYHGTFLGYLSGAIRRVGYTENSSREKAEWNRRYDILLSQVLQPGDVKHEVEICLDVLRHLGSIVQDDRLEVWTSPQDEKRARQILQQTDFRDDSPIVAFGLGAGAPYRQWPVENFIECGRWLAQEHSARILLVGGRCEQPLAGKLKAELKSQVIDACGQTSLRETAALLGLATLYVGNDTGVMHLAAAQGVPVVEISCYPATAPVSHANSPVRFGPWKVPAVILQPAAPRQPCQGACQSQGAHCILDVSVLQVQEAMSRLLSSRVSHVAV
jgi:heptosyltransferase-2